MTLETQSSVNISGPIQILKVDNRHVIAGYATAKVRDIEDTIGIETLEQAVQNLFMDPAVYQKIPVKHGDSEVGRLIAQATDSQGRTWTTNSDQGLFLLCEIDKPKTNDAIEAGQLRIFSITGEAIRTSSSNGGDVITLDKITIYLEDSPTRFLIIKTIPIDVDKVVREVKDRILKEHPELLPQDGPINLDQLSKMTWPEVEDYEYRRRLARGPLVI
jgi:hypothetical protein